MRTADTMIYIGQCDGKEFVYALREDMAKSLIEGHWAFRSQAEDAFAVGTEWAKDESHPGWRVIERRMALPIVDVELRGVPEVDTAHMIWKCPFCGKSYSDDWMAEDTFPVLLMCRCNKERKYLLGVTTGYGSAGLS